MANQDTLTINSQYVDIKYLPTLLPNFYYDSVLLPGVTFTDAAVEQAGGWYFHKLGSNAVVDPTTVGGSFSGSTTADTLVQAVINNAFRVEEKVFGITDSSVAYNKTEAEYARVVKEVSEGWQQAGLACLVNESTDLADTTAIDDTNVLSYIISMRKAVKDKKGNPEYAMVSTSVYEEILTQAGGDFVPVKNDEVISTGRAGLWYGIRVIEANALNATAAKYFPYSDSANATTVNLSLVDIVMGDANAFGIKNIVQAMRVIDTEDYAGKKIQVEINSAFRVTNSDMVITKYHAESSI